MSPDRHARTVSPEFTAHESRVTGRINRAHLAVGNDDHLVDPDERLPVAMAR